MSNNRERCLDALQSGTIDSWAHFRQTVEILDVSDADLSQRDFSGWDLSKAVFTGSNLSNADLSRATLEDARFHRAVLTGANLTDAEAERANFEDANLENAILKGARLANASLGGAIASGADFEGCNLKEATVPRVSFLRANLKSAQLTGANAVSAKFRYANLELANLRDSIMNHADFTGAQISRTHFLNASVLNADFHGVRGAQLAFNLSRTNVGVSPENFPKHFDTCRRSLVHRLDWEKIKMLGRMQLFGVSYFLMLLLVSSFFAIGQYNEHLSLAHAWAQSAKHDGNIATRRIAVQVERLRPMSISRSSVWLLFSTTVLVVASIIYTLACPSEIKDFSSPQWQYAHNRSLIHYWPRAWVRPRLRMTCLSLYIVGAGIFVPITAYKIGVAVKYAAQFVE